MIHVLLLLLLVAGVSLAWACAGRAEAFEASGDGGGAIIIVEPRAHPAFKYVLDLYIRRVPSDWKLYVFHGSKNGEYARQAAQGWIQANREVEFRDLGVANLDAAAYNKLFKTRAFWESMDVENLLVVQTDSVPCAASPFDLAQFTKFPYIGCAYGDKVGKNTFWDGFGFYGSGGLSFRKRSFALKCTAARPPGVEPEAEDVTFGECVAEFGNPKPTAQDLLDFCTQNNFGSKSWGAHQIGNQLPQAQKKAFVNYCPESAAI